MRYIAGLVLAFAVVGCRPTAVASTAESSPITLRLDTPSAEARAVYVTVEETPEQTNVLVDEPDLRVAVVVSHTAGIDNAVGYWREGGDFTVCAAELARDGAWLAFEGPCAKGRVLLP
jgi:hypothetical protein